MTVKLPKFLKKISSFRKRIDDLSNIINYGRLISINGLILEVLGLNSSIGSECFIERMIEDKKSDITAEVISFSGHKTFLLALEDTYGLLPGARVFIKRGYNKNYLIKKIPLTCMGVNPCRPHQ